MEILEQLTTKIISFPEAEKLCVEKKSELFAHEEFLKMVEFDTWDAAVSAVPEFATNEALKRFKLRRGKPLPQSFKVCKITSTLITKPRELFLFLCIPL